MPYTPYLIIGGGMTGAAAANAIRELDDTGTIGLISAEPDPPYDRPPLSKKLWGGKTSVDDIYIKLPGNVQPYFGRRVMAIEQRRRRHHANVVFGSIWRRFFHLSAYPARKASPIRL